MTALSCSARTAKVGLVIGKGGSRIKLIRQATGCKITIDQPDPAGAAAAAASVAGASAATSTTTTGAAGAGAVALGDGGEAAAAVPAAAGTAVARLEGTPRAVLAAKVG